MKMAAIVFALAIAAGSPAFAQMVSVHYAHLVDCSKFRTYKWGTNKGQSPDKEEDDYIKTKLDRVLEENGLRRLDSGSADLVVTYQATVREEVQKIDLYGDDSDMNLGRNWGWGMGWGWGWGDLGPSFSTSTVETIRKGDLLVDIADPATKSIIFRGYAKDAFHSNPIKEDRLFSKAIGKMFRSNPQPGSLPPFRLLFPLERPEFPFPG